MFTLEICDYQGNCFKEWKWFSMPIPNKGDTLLIHFDENEYRVNVLRREFDGTRPDVIRIITDYVSRLSKNGEIEEEMLP